MHIDIHPIWFYTNNKRLFMKNLSLFFTNYMIDAEHPSSLESKHFLCFTKKGEPFFTTFSVFEDRQYTSGKIWQLSAKDKYALDPYGSILACVEKKQELYPYPYDSNIHMYPTPQKEVFIETLSVDASVRGKGVGFSLLRMLLYISQQKKTDYVTGSFQPFNFLNGIKPADQQYLKHFYMHSGLLVTAYPQPQKLLFNTMYANLKSLKQERIYHETQKAMVSDESQTFYIFDPYKTSKLSEKQKEKLLKKVSNNYFETHTNHTLI